MGNLFSRSATADPNPNENGCDMDDQVEEKHTEPAPVRLLPKWPQDKPNNDNEGETIQRPLKQLILPQLQPRHPYQAWTKQVTDYGASIPAQAPIVEKDSQTMNCGRIYLMGTMTPYEKTIRDALLEIHRYRPSRPIPATPINAYPTKTRSNVFWGRPNLYQDNKM